VSKVQVKIVPDAEQWSSMSSNSSLAVATPASLDASMTAVTSCRAYDCSYA
jgi:hypothetical protein